MPAWPAAAAIAARPFTDSGISRDMAISPSLNWFMPSGVGKSTTFCTSAIALSNCMASRTGAAMAPRRA